MAEAGERARARAGERVRRACAGPLVLARRPLTLAAGGEVLDGGVMVLTMSRPQSGNSWTEPRGVHTPVLRVAV